MKTLVERRSVLDSTGKIGSITNKNISLKHNPKSHFFKNVYNYRFYNMINN